MTKKSVVVASKLGLHARPANLLIKEAQKYKCNIEIGVGDKVYNAKSILGVLAAGVNYNTEIEVICSGDGEEEACAALVEFIANGLDEE